MLIKEQLLTESEKRLRRARMNANKLQQLDRSLGDGQIHLTGEQKEQRLRQLLNLTQDPVTARLGLERIIAGNDLDSINYLAKGTEAARSVCRIQLKDSASNLIGYASGFLIGPGVLMTNNHVFGSKEDARNSMADFDYELDLRGKERPVTHFAFRPDDLFYTNPDLDYSVVAIEASSIEGGRELSAWGWLPLNGEPGKADLGEYLTIIQHPGGERKQVCVRENKLLKYMDQAVWYKTDTLGGSSGSPVFNRFWQVVALHHSGVPRKDKQGRTLRKDGNVWNASMDESLIDWIANEGIRVSSIAADLKANRGAHPLVREVLRGAPPPESVSASLDRSRKRGVWVEQDSEGTSLIVPLRVPVELVQRELGMIPPRQANQGDAAYAGDHLPMEAVKIDQSTLNKRRVISQTSSAKALCRSHCRRFQPRLRRRSRGEEMRQHNPN